MQKRACKKDKRAAKAKRDQRAAECWEAFHEQGVTQTELAARYKVNVSTVSRWIKRHTVKAAPPKKVRDWAAEYQKRTGELLDTHWKDREDPARAELLVKILKPWANARGVDRPEVVPFELTIELVRAIREIVRTCLHDQPDVAAEVEGRIRALADGVKPQKGKKR